MFCHKKSLFPFVILFFTCVLGVFMFNAFSHRSNTSSVEGVVISKSAYESHVKSIVNDFSGAYASAPNDATKLKLVEKALSDLLDLRVPSEDKDVHLSLAIALNQMKEELASKQTTDGFAKFQDARSHIESWK